MHTHDKLFGGTLCKCMDCASQRQQRLHIEALRRHTNVYRSCEDDFMRAGDLEREAKKIRDEAMERQRALLDQVREEMKED